jgi:hypothetical protein
MSGWQRIGVVISVLWLLGLSIYFVADAYKNSTKYADFLENVCMAGRHDSSPEGKLTSVSAMPSRQEEPSFVPRSHRLSKMFSYGSFCWGRSSFYGSLAGSFWARCVGFDAALRAGSPLAVRFRSPSGITSTHADARLRADARGRDGG